MKNIAVFVSGGGSDMQSVIDACERGEINGRVVTVVAGKSGIYAIERAKKHNIECKVFSLKEYGTPEAKDKAIVEYLKPFNIDLIVLAGYLSIVSRPLLDIYEGRIINIHPSLIPAYCGMGMYGLRVHKAVIEGGESISGCTVHFVDGGADTGKIIRQVKVSVLPGDTPESLQSRILEQEHILLPKVVAELCNE